MSPRIAPLTSYSYILRTQFEINKASGAYKLCVTIYIPCDIQHREDAAKTL